MPTQNPSKDATIEAVISTTWDGFNGTKSDIGSILNSGSSILIPNEDDLNSQTSRYTMLSGLITVCIAANAMSSTDSYRQKLGYGLKAKTTLKKVLHAIWSPVISYEASKNNPTFVSYVRDTFDKEVDGRSTSFAAVYNALRLSIADIIGAIDLTHIVDINKDVADIDAIESQTSVDLRRKQYLYISKLSGNDEVKKIMENDGRINKIFSGEIGGYQVNGKDVIATMESKGQISIINGCLANLKNEIIRNGAYVICRKGKGSGAYVLVYAYESATKTLFVYDCTTAEKYWKYTEDEITENFGTTYKFISLKGAGTQQQYAQVGSEEYRRQVEVFGKSCYTSNNGSDQTDLDISLIDKVMPDPTMYSASYKLIIILDGMRLARTWMENVLGKRYIWGGGHENIPVKSYSEVITGRDMLVRGPSLGTTYNKDAKKLEIHNGFDCSGGIIYSLCKMGYKVPTFWNTDGIFDNLTKTSVSRDDLWSGDICLVKSEVGETRWKYVHVFIVFNSRDVQPGGPYTDQTSTEQWYALNASGSYYPEEPKSSKEKVYKSSIISYGINNILTLDNLTKNILDRCEFYRLDWDKIKQWT